MADALSGFSNSLIWLIGIAFFISRGFIKTGLGSRIAYYFVRIFGKSTLGISYGLSFAELILSTVMPSNTARGGGVMYPINRSISELMGSLPTDETRLKIGAFRFCFFVMCFDHTLWDRISSGFIWRGLCNNG